MPIKVSYANKIITANTIIFQKQKIITANKIIFQKQKQLELLPMEINFSRQNRIHSITLHITK